MFELFKAGSGVRAVTFYGNELGQIVVVGADGSKGIGGDIRKPEQRINLPGGNAKTIREFLFDCFDQMSQEHMNKHWLELKPYFNATQENKRR